MRTLLFACCFGFFSGDVLAEDPKMDGQWEVSYSPGSIVDYISIKGNMIVVKSTGSMLISSIPQNGGDVVWGEIVLRADELGACQEGKGPVFQRIREGSDLLFVNQTPKASGLVRGKMVKTGVKYPDYAVKLFSDMELARSQAEKRKEEQIKEARALAASLESSLEGSWIATYPNGKKESWNFNFKGQWLVILSEKDGITSDKFRMRGMQILLGAEATNPNANPNTYYEVSRRGENFDISISLSGIPLRFSLSSRAKEFPQLVKEAFSKLESKASVKNEIKGILNR